MKFLLIICLVFGAGQLFSQSYDLSIVISNLKNKTGKIQIGIYNKKEDFPKVDKQFRVYYFDTSEFSGVYTVHGLPEGEYAVAITHDENADNICNTNFWGFPTEGFGFSNNVRPIFSIPDFNDCKFELDSNLTITIKMIY